MLGRVLWIFKATYSAIGNIVLTHLLNDAEGC